VADLHGSGDEMWIQRVTRVLPEELSVSREQAWIQDFENARKINLGILGIWMVAMDKKS